MSLSLSQLPVCLWWNDCKFCVELPKELSKLRIIKLRRRIGNYLIWWSCPWQPTNGYLFHGPFSGSVGGNCGCVVICTVINVVVKVESIFTLVMPGYTINWYFVPEVKFWFQRCGSLDFGSLMLNACWTFHVLKSSDQMTGIPLLTEHLCKHLWGWMSQILVQTE